MSSNSFFREFIDFMKHRKKFWLLPIVVFAVLIILLILLASDNALTPFIYDLF